MKVKLEKFARKMITIRLVEEALLDWFSEGLVQGTTHTYIGQEATASGVIACLNPSKDYVISNHRNHGHYICFGGEIFPLFAEVLGREGALCDGYGGSQHLHNHHFFSFGILGGIAPIACGISMGIEMNNHSGIVAIFLGDGALCQGVVYEAINIASLWKLPVLFVIENNQIAQTTQFEMHSAGPLEKRPEAFIIPTTSIISTDVELIYKKSKNIIDSIRKNRSPQAVVIHNVRLGPHSKGDDTRSSEELENANLNDPLLQLKEKLNDNYEILYSEVKTLIEKEKKKVLKSPFIT